MVLSFNKGGSLFFFSYFPFHAVCTHLHLRMYHGYTFVLSFHFVSHHLNVESVDDVLYLYCSFALHVVTILTQQEVNLALSRVTLHPTFILYYKPVYFEPKCDIAMI